MENRLPHKVFWRHHVVAKDDYPEVEEEVEVLAYSPTSGEGSGAFLIQLSDGSFKEVAVATCFITQKKGAKCL